MCISKYFRYIDQNNNLLMYFHFKLIGNIATLKQILKKYTVYDISANKNENSIFLDLFLFITLFYAFGTIF